MKTKAASEKASAILEYRRVVSPTWCRQIHNFAWLVPFRLQRKQKEFTVTFNIKYFHYNYKQRLFHTQMATEIIKWTHTLHDDIKANKNSNNYHVSQSWPASQPTKFAQIVNMGHTAYPNNLFYMSLSHSAWYDVNETRRLTKKAAPIRREPVPDMPCTVEFCNNTVKKNNLLSNLCQVYTIPITKTAYSKATGYKWPLLSANTNVRSILWIHILYICATWTSAGGVAVVRTSVFGWWAFPNLCLIHGWRVTTSWVRGQLWVNQPGQLSLPSLWGGGSINE